MLIQKRSMQNLLTELQDKRADLWTKFNKLDRSPLKESGGTEPKVEGVININEAREQDRVIGIWLITCPPLRHGHGRWETFYLHATVKRKRRLDVSNRLELRSDYKFYVFKTKGESYCSSDYYDVDPIGELIWTVDYRNEKTGVFLPHYIDSNANY